MEETKPQKNLNIWVITTLILALVVGALFIRDNSAKALKGADGKSYPALTSDQAKQRLNDFFTQVYGERITVEIKEISEVDGMYKVAVGISDKTQGTQDKGDIYLSRDGKLFIPQALSIDEALTQAQAAKAAAAQVPTGTPSPEANIPEDSVNANTNTNMNKAPVKKTPTTNTNTNKPVPQ